MKTRLIKPRTISFYSLIGILATIYLTPIPLSVFARPPMENVLQVSPYFPNSRVLIAVHGGHGVLEPLAIQLPEVFAALLEFLKSGNTSKLPARVTLPAPKFSPPTFALPVSKRQ